MKRGSEHNPVNRFEAIDYTPDLTDLEYVLLDEELPSPKTKFYRDSSKTILSTNDSPDVGFDFSVNSYRGCEHGCAYCYARPTHEYLGMSAGLDFETKIFVKDQAPALLREKLFTPTYKPQVIVMSGVTDCYQPAERNFKLTRGCLEVLRDFKNPAAIITKNALVTRDIDVFTDMAKYQGIMITLSVTTLDQDLCGVLEPRTSRPQARLRAVEMLAKAGIPVGVNIAPVIPGLTDHEMPAILKAASEAGATHAGYTVLRLPYGVTPLFVEWLEQHRPEKKEKVLSHLRSLRGGKLNDSNFKSRMKGEGAFADNIRQMFKLYTKKYGLNLRRWNLSAEHFQRPGRQGDQLDLL